MALPLYDAFRGHKGEEMQSLLMAITTLTEWLPNNCTRGGFRIFIDIKAVQTMRGACGGTEKQRRCCWPTLLLCYISGTYARYAGYSLCLCDRGEPRAVGWTNLLLRVWCHTRLEEGEATAPHAPPWIRVGCPDLLETLDLSVNKPLKDQLRNRFQVWYIHTQNRFLTWKTPKKHYCGHTTLSCVTSWCEVAD